MPWSSTDPRLFITLTLDEAAALVRLQPGADGAAIGALAKIRTALEGATTPPPPLRAKSYQMAKAALPPRPDPPSPPATRRPRRARLQPSNPPDVDYVPFRDEAGGIYT